MKITKNIYLLSLKLTRTNYILLIVKNLKQSVEFWMVSYNAVGTGCPNDVVLASKRYTKVVIAFERLFSGWERMNS